MLIVLLLIFLPALSWTQSGHLEGVIFGRVMNGTRDSTAVADQEVMLFKYASERKVQNFQMHTVTDAQGWFVFEGLETGASFKYYPAAMYRDVEYSGMFVKPLPSDLRKQSDIVFFEPASSDSVISAVMHHLIVQSGAGALIVREVLLFANRDNHTYVGNTSVAPGKNIILKMEVPPEAADLQLGGDIMSCCTVVKANQIFDTMPFKPGTRQVVVSYRLPYKGREANLIKVIHSPTNAFDVFLADSRLSSLSVSTDDKENVVFSSMQLQEPEPFQIRGKQYDRYNVGPLGEGSEMTLTVSDLEAAPSNYAWLAPIVLILVIIVGYISNRKWDYRRQSGRDKKEPRVPSIEERSLLINRILQLDKDFELGEIDEVSYHLEREKSVQAVLNIDGQNEN